MKFIKNKLAVTVVVLSVAFLLIIGISSRENTSVPIESGVSLTVSGVSAGIYKGFNKFIDYFSVVTEFSSVKKENENLKKENVKLKEAALENEALRWENDRLRGILDYKTQKQDYNYVLCDIIGKSGGNLLEEFVINRGSKSGIKKDMVVITTEGLVGQVVKTTYNTATVESLANENIAVAAQVLDTRENTGVVKGFKDTENKLLAKLYYLPLESTIKPNDVILTSGLSGGLYPKDIKIGSVISVEKDAGRSMVIATIKPYVDLTKLEEVMVAVPKSAK